MRSRSLLSLEHQPNFQSMACDWFHHIFVRKREDTGSSYFSMISNDVDVCDASECEEDHLPSSDLIGFSEELINVSGHRRNKHSDSTLSSNGWRWSYI